ncbi:Two-component sensor histidine kinase protein [Salinisphaera shabanensis E1L3A]|uniref:histidine kinase n=1 Tax=Salinisphaera shabanensis E1L3A TaxID=1033802 RepID=U2FYM9_9GAMM|nr:ATP-binding protein [Salinisphaera shabanensis]ERJ19258.1 Two-component sensor histidine kinase protein [Salinisphaera shabanensis E1L3A]
MAYQSNDESYKQHGKPLRPRARIIRALGEDLISSEQVAILELVKNAYDADASCVAVRFKGELEKNTSCIEIEDDGVGMNLGTVRSAWMEPGTATKKKNTRSSFLNRRVLGEKGVGRFASARLASELELITRPVDSPNETYAYFDWTQFDNDSLFLDEVILLAEEREPAFFTASSAPAPANSDQHQLPRDGSHGTLLRMSPLKRSWRPKDLEQLGHALSRLVSPAGQSEDFRIFLETSGKGEPVKQEVSPPEALKYPHYSAEATIDADGAFTLHIQVFGTGGERTKNGWYRQVPDADMAIRDIPMRQDLAGTCKPACGPLAIEIKAWDLDDLEGTKQKLGVGIRSIRADVKSVSGISIYRDGFRVLPYGEQDNDWLRLDMRRVNTPSKKFSNNQIVGVVRIGADENPDLYDQSNREGLTDNKAFEDLSSIMLAILSELERVRNEAKKKPKDPRNDTTRDALLAPPEMGDLRSELKQDGASKKTIELVDQKAREWKQQVDRIGKVLAQYHSLATLGQLVDKIVHEARQPLSTINAQGTLISERITKFKRKEAELSEECIKAIDDSSKKVDRILDAGKLMHEVISRVEPLGGRKRGRPSKLYIDQIIQEAFSHFRSELTQLGVEVELPTESFLVTVDRSELQEVFINLLSNSLYWLRQVPRERRSILVACSRPGEGVLQILFSDSGPGIASDDREAVFQPYFSTREDGVGLGLVIVGEIIKDFYDGAFEIMDEGPLPGATFRITLRKRV